MELNFLGEPDKENYFSIEEYINLNCPTHSHFAMEIIIAKHGEFLVEVNGKKYTLTENTAILIMPFETHKFITENFSNVLILTVTPTIFAEYKTKMENQTLSNPLISIDSNEMKFILKQCANIKDGNIFEIKSVFYTLLGMFKKSSEFIPSKVVPDSIYVKAIMYVGNHYTQDITLKQLAKELHVSYVYLSRVLNKDESKGFSKLLNSFRLEHALKLLKTTDMDISEIAYESGFGCIRSFNRLFKETLKCTPLEFKNNKGNKGEWKYYDIKGITERENNAYRKIEI